jgi:hypothetical protein
VCGLDLADFTSVIDHGIHSCGDFGVRCGR